MRSLVMRFYSLLASVHCILQVLKEDLIVHLENMMETVSSLLKTVLQFEMSEALNLDKLMDAVSACSLSLLLGRAVTLYCSLVMATV